jgi:arylsulfatase A-like enzyme
MLADDLGHGDVSYIAQSKFYSTPHIDAMAASQNAFRMDRFYSAATVCSPSRAAMLAVQHNVRTCIFGSNNKEGRIGWVIGHVLENWICFGA